MVKRPNIDRKPLFHMKMVLWRDSGGTVEGQ